MRSRSVVAWLAALEAQPGPLGVRKGKPTPVVGKALVQLDGEPFLSFAASRGSWERKDHYLFPGSIQYFGPSEVCDLRTRTLLLEHGEKDLDADNE